MPSLSSRHCGRERAAPTVSKISLYKGHASVGKHNRFFKKSLHFLYVLSHVSTRFFSLSPKGLSGHWLFTCNTRRDGDSVKGVYGVSGCNKLPTPYHQPCLEGSFISYAHTSSHFTFRGWHLHPATEKNKYAYSPVPAHTQSCPTRPSYKAFNLQTLCHYIAEVGAGSIKRAILLRDAGEPSCLPTRR